MVLYVIEYTGRQEATVSMTHLGVAQLVARYLGVVEAASSSLVTQTRRRFVRISSFLLFSLVFSLFRVSKLLTRPRKLGQKSAFFEAIPS